MHVASVSLLFLLLASVFDCCHTSSQNAWASVARCYTPHLLALLMPCFCLVANIHALVCQHVPRAMLFSQSAVTCCMSLVLSSPSTAMFYIFKGRSFFFFKGRHAYRDSARPQCKHAKSQQGRLLRGGAPVRESMTGQHACMQAKRTAAAQEVLRFASSTQRTHAGNVTHLTCSSVIK